PFDPLTNDFVTLQFFFAQWNSLLSHTDIFTEALQYDNITDEQHIDDELALTAKANIRFIHPVKEGDRVIAKAKVVNRMDEKGRTLVEVNSYVNQKLVFTGEFYMYRSNKPLKESQNENSH
ncbi:hotdog domain-containing protein, partial [Caldibacillus debilis]